MATRGTGALCAPELGVAPLVLLYFRATKSPFQMNSVTSFVVRNILDNVLRHSNDAKYRSVRTTCATFMHHVQPFPEAVALIRDAGFELSGEHYVLAPGSAATRRVLSVRLAVWPETVVPLPPGVHRDPTDGDDLEDRCKRFQKSVYLCTACRRIIVDGSERAWTGSYTAPKGQWRYSCDQCAFVHVCESCFEGFQRTHDVRHTWTLHPPITSRLQAASASSSSSTDTFNGPAPAPSPSAYRKLYERYGF